MKKIAIATEGQNVSAHFGHCQGFFVVTTEAGQILDEEFVANPGHKPGLLPNLLHQQGVQVIIAGGMGPGAIDIFYDKQIDVITGATGPVTEALNLYLTGQLRSTGTVCHDHAHAGDCGSHEH